MNLTLEYGESRVIRAPFDIFSPRVKTRSASKVLPVVFRRKLLTWSHTKAPFATELHSPSCCPMSSPDNVPSIDIASTYGALLIGGKSEHFEELGLTSSSIFRDIVCSIIPSRYWASFVSKAFKGSSLSRRTYTVRAAYFLSDHNSESRHTNR